MYGNFPTHMEPEPRPGLGRSQPPPLVPLTTFAREFSSRIPYGTTAGRSFLIAAVNAGTTSRVLVVVVAPRPSDTARAVPPLLPALDTLPAVDTAAVVLYYKSIDAAASAVRAVG